MVNDLDAIREEIVRVCTEEYEYCKDSDSYFIAKNQQAYHVRQNILSKINAEYLSERYIDSLVYILDVNGDTFINIT